jgi:hypothetical protein
MPVWNDLTKKELPKASTGPTEEEKARVIKDRQRLDARLKSANERIEELLSTLKDAEKVRLDLTKQVQTASQTAKFDKIASDGIAKRSAVFEYEATTLKAERKIMIEEQIFNRKRVKELELALNDVRAKHIKVVHEVELLGRRNNELIAIADIAERKVVEANKTLLEKLQRVTTLESIMESQKRVIESQGGEMTSMGKELLNLKEDVRSVTQTVLMQEQTIATKALDRDILEAQVSTLKKNVMDLAVTTSEKSLAYKTTFGETNGTYRVGSNNGRARAEPRDTRLKNQLQIDTSDAMEFGSIGSGSENRSATAGVGMGTGTGGRDRDVFSKSLPALRHSPTGRYASDQFSSTRPSTTLSVLSPIAAPYSPHSKSIGLEMSALGMDRISTAHAFTRGGDNDLERARSSQNARRPGSQSRQIMNSQSSGNLDAMSVSSQGSLGGDGATFVSGGGSVGAQSLDSADVADREAERKLEEAKAREDSELQERANKMASDQQARREAKRAQSTATNNLTGRNRTKFVGSGLGMRQNSVGFNPQGSAKMMLKKIMADFEA